MSGIPASIGSRNAIVASVIVQASSVIPFSLMAAMAVSMRRDLGFDERMLGMLVASSFAAAAVCAIPAGRLVERIGSAAGVRVAGCLASAGMLGIAFAAQSLASAMPFLALIGISIAVAQPATDALMTEHVDRRHQGMAFAIKQTAGGPAMAVLAGLSVPTIGAAYGWRSAFAAAAVVAALVVFVNPAGALRGGGRALARRVRGSVLDAGTRRVVLVLTLAGFVGTIAQNSFTAFAVSAGVHHGMTEGRAATVYAFGGAAGIISRLAGGRFADRHPERLWAAIAGLFLVGVAGFAIMAIARPVATMIAVPLLCATVWGWPGLYFLAVARSSPSAPARASGTVLAGVLTGGVVGPLCFGLIAAHSYRVGWVVLSTCAVIAAAAIVVGGAMTRRLAG